MGIQFIKGIAIGLCEACYQLRLIILGFNAKSINTVEFIQIWIIAQVIGKQYVIAAVLVHTKRMNSADAVP